MEVLLGILTLVSTAVLFKIAERIAEPFIRAQHCPRCGAELDDPKPPFLVEYRYRSRTKCGKCFSLFSWSGQLQRYLIVLAVLAPVGIGGILLFRKMDSPSVAIAVALTTVIAYLAADRLTANQSRPRYISSLREAFEKHPFATYLSVPDSGYFPGALTDIFEEVDNRLANDDWRGAEAHLRSALLAEPERVDLKIRLLEVLIEAGEIERFQSQFAVWRSELKNTVPEQQFRALLEKRSQAKRIGGDA